MPALGLVLLLVLALPLAAQAPSPADLARADHVLNRLAFGPRPGEVERVARMGVDRWIAEQLQPISGLDSAGSRALWDCPIWTLPAVTRVNPVLLFPLPSMTPATMAADSARRRLLASILTDTNNILVSASLPLRPAVTADSASRAGASGRLLIDSNQFFGCRLARVEASDQQLVEVMTDFWENHFSVHIGRTMGRQMYVGWDRDVIRPRALGRFRDLLGAVAHHPIMLDYLDNSISKASKLNENYGRELLELHTLGVDGGYTQADVIDVARAFTGWTHTGPVVGTGQAPQRPVPATTLEFEFVAADHDTGRKTVLGTTLAPNRGMEDGEQVLDIVARHPSTARYLAKKLAVRFVSDNPPAALIERVAATYIRTDGNIREMVRAIVTSPEFFAPAAERAKVKSPLELVLSMRRALGAPEDVTAEAVSLLVELNQAPIGRLSPDGWPETADGWLGAGALMTRVSIGQRVAAGQVPSIPLEKWPEWKRLSTLPFEAQLDGVVQSLLGGHVSGTTRAALRAVPQYALRELVLRDLVGLALASPEFQRR